jgi:hypothetical protein
MGHQKLDRYYKMTPLEIYEYKFKWLKSCNNHVEINEDNDYLAKAWCKKNLKQHQWQFTRYTSNYEHTISFEIEEFKLQFINNYLNDQ